MKTYSLDLRQKVVAAADKAELSQGRLAELFEVSVSWLKKLLHQRRMLGHIEPLAHGGGREPLLDAERLEALRAEIARHPDATLAELCQRVGGVGGEPVSIPTMSRAVASLGLTRKKEGALGRGSRSQGARRALGVDGGAAARGAAACLH